VQNILKSVELYNPTVKQFTLLNDLQVGRVYHAASLLQNGKILITGGQTQQYPEGDSSAEIYDVVAGSTPAAPMSTYRMNQSSIALADGTVMILGGNGGMIVAGTRLPYLATFGGNPIPGGALPTVEIYDPVTQAFISGPSAPISGSVPTQQASANLNTPTISQALSSDGSHVVFSESYTSLTDTLGTFYDLTNANTYVSAIPAPSTAQ
jgi:hypothetical protein